ncbi:MAG: Gfo/Idh/MocA family oxidoreductase, partial [Parcubacteria group bacterium]|nr:Gfo/Idh/MocA family oxidoreductase [Parcubacteria group bacterium]
QDLFSDTELDAVVVATPVSTHSSLASVALKSGKHVLLEKPMAATSRECDALAVLARERNRILMVDHTFLYTGAVRKIKELVERGELGELRYFDSERINLGLIQPDVNVLWDLAPHDISIMNHVFAGIRPVSVFATGTRHVSSHADEMAHLTVQFERGIVGHIHASWLSPVKIRKVLIGGSKKMVLYDDTHPSEKVKVYDKGVTIDFSSETPDTPVYRSGDVFIPKLDDEEALYREARHFIACIRGREFPLVDSQAGREVVRILEASDASMREGRIVYL